MSRPDHVRCENCAAWWHSQCHLQPKGVNRGPEDGCIQFRAEWPEAPVYDWDNPAHRPIIERAMHPLIRVQLKDDGDIETAEYVKALRKAYGTKVEGEDVPST